MGSCIFCKISNKEIPAKIVLEDEDVMAFHDVNPIAPVHVLIIPKKHISSINQISSEDIGLVGKLIFTASVVAKNLGISEDGYKLLFRVGRNGGQEVPHIHLHLLGGAKLYEEIRPSDALQE